MSGCLGPDARHEPCRGPASGLASALASALAAAPVRGGFATGSGAPFVPLANFATGVTGIGDTPFAVATPSSDGVVTYVKWTYTFTATATTHTLRVQGYSSGITANAGILADDIVLTENAWTEPGGLVSGPQASVSDSVVRSQSGRILQNTLTDGPVTETSTYSYDAAGRLVSAAIPRHQLSYGFAATGGCGQNVAAGRNGNRTSFADVKDAGAPVTVAYCYDNADRLTGSTVTGAPAGMGPVGGGNLSTAGPATPPHWLTRRWYMTWPTGT